MKRLILIISFCGILFSCKTPPVIEVLSSPEHAQQNAPIENDDWFTSVKGHINPSSVENNESRELFANISRKKKSAKGKIELVPALKQIGDSPQYVDIYTNDPWEQPYDGYGDLMWYFRIDCKDQVVKPLFLHYYYDPKFVYEGDLDQDGIPDFGILLRRESNCCAYALLTINNGHWALLTEPFLVAQNLRASGKELAKKGEKKGEIIITKSGSTNDGLSTCMESPIVDTVITARRIDTHDFL